MENEGPYKKKKILAGDKKSRWPTVVRRWVENSGLRSLRVGLSVRNW